ncbi:MAG: hypothetical protein ACE5Q3_09405, partial [Alphaproteobacteria bacterium]
PGGAALSAGIDNGDGSWTLAPEELGGLSLTPPRDYNGDITLGIAAVASDGNDTARETATIAIRVDPVADPPQLTLNDATGDEDREIGLDITVAPAVATETVSLAIGGLPPEAALSAGRDDGDGGWVISAEDLAGLTFTPPPDYNGTLTLTVSATATDGPDVTLVRRLLDVTVRPVADPPMLMARDAAGPGLDAVPLEIAVTPTGATETLSVIVEGVPAGGSLSAGQDEGDGTWTLEPRQLSALRLVPPPDYAGIMALTVSVVATDGRDMALVRRFIDVTVEAVADPAKLPPDATAAAYGLGRPDATETDPGKPAESEKPLLAGDITAAPPPEAARLLSRGDDFLKIGDLASARLFYELAATQGSARAATAIARTYDPVFFEETGVRGASPDPAKAAGWYREAMEGGEPAAARHLEELVVWLERRTPGDTEARRLLDQLRRARAERTVIRP